MQEARALKGWSQEELAAQLGTTFETVSRWERGIMLPSPYFRTRLCAVFGMTAEALGLLFEAETALHSSLSSTQAVVAWAVLDKEHEVVGHVLAALQAQGIRTVSPWLLGRRGPAQKQERLDEAIRAAQLVLLILSPHAPASRDMRTTLHLARLYGRPLAALWIAGDQQQECLPPNVPSLLSLIDARTGDKETIVQGVLDLVEQTAPAEHAKMEEPPLPAETSSVEEGFQQTSLEVLEWPVEEDTLHVEPRPLSTLERRNRQRFLDKVQAFWITGVLEHSLHGMARIVLRFAALPDAVEHPWRLVFAQSDRPPLLFEAGTTMSQVYDRACGELLILGEPGAGKTTLLLELARDLIARARSDETLPLPVVFNLSSWSQKQLPLAEWLVEELHLKYQVPHQLGTVWVQTDSLLPLLDGVDEVAAEHREACIKAINAFRWEHGLLPMVVCSRSNDYFMQPQRIVLHSAVTVQPLTPVQIEAYVEQAGEPLYALRAALHQDTMLRELTSTPLMLSILTLTYQGLPVEDLLRKASLMDQQRRVFEHYIERMLRHRGSMMHHTREQTTHWLAWLAWQMQKHNQTVFYIEHLQPDWLTGEQMHRTYDRWALRFPAILMGMLVSVAITLLLAPAAAPSLSALAISLAPIMVLGGFIGWLLDTGSTIQQPHENIRKTRNLSWSRLVKRLRVGILIWLIFGLTVGLTFGLISGLISGLSAMLLQAALEKSNRAASSFQVPHTSWKLRWQNRMKHVGIRNGILVGLIVGLSGGLTSGLGYGLGAGLLNGLISGLSAGLFSGLLSMLLIGKPIGITLTDELVWSWRSLGRSLFTKRHISTTSRVMVSTLLIVALASVLSTGLRYVLQDGLAAGLSAGLSCWLLLGLFQGVSRETIEDQYRVVPNQGIRHSARNSLILGLISTGIAGLATGLAYGLAYGLIDGLSTGLAYGLSVGLIIGLSAGLLAGLLYGGLACLRHGVMRHLLWRAGSIPRNYPRFLDDAAERILLRKVGGGYIFVHRLLLEYFASLDGAPTLDVARAKKERESPVS
ncbi:MAG TPA: helix-turn-helix domain-containing protein [Ktedonobacteraceae bacterium]